MVIKAPRKLASKTKPVKPVVVKKTPAKVLPKRSYKKPAIQKKSVPMSAHPDKSGDSMEGMVLQ